MICTFSGTIAQKLLLVVVTGPTEKGSLNLLTITDRSMMMVLGLQTGTMSPEKALGTLLYPLITFMQLVNV